MTYFYPCNDGQRVAMFENSRRIQIRNEISTTDRYLQSSVTSQIDIVLASLALTSRHMYCNGNEKTTYGEIIANQKRTV